MFCEHCWGKDHTIKNCPTLDKQAKDLADHIDADLLEKIYAKQKSQSNKETNLRR